MCTYLFSEDKMVPEPDLHPTVEVYKAPAKVSLEMDFFPQDFFQKGRVDSQSLPIIVTGRTQGRFF
jgi:hypothetical protein